MFKECADIQTADMLKLPVPALVGGKPTNIQLKPSEIQKQMVAELGERADKIRNKMVKPYEDNMLKITNDGRKLALDQRLIDPDLPDDPDSKVNICVGKIFEIWEQTMPQRSAQLVFCDLSTPKAGVFNVYDDMKAKLIERGIPETEIAFIHEANTDARKTELFGKVRSGAVRVLMGSTAKMGAGTNVQKRLIALHHLDVPWRPSDIEQREGRILRQGNENKEVYVFRYVTEGTFDAYSWQLIENKQKFIGQIMTSKSPARSCNDMDEAALSYAEVKALAAGNPLIKEKMDLDVQLTRLKTLKAAHDSQRYELENKIAIGFPAEIRKCKEQIENATVDAATVKEHSVVDADGKDVFCIQLEKKVYYKKEPAGKALLGLLGLALNSEKPVPIGYFKGMELQIQHLPFGNEYHARLAGSGTYSTQLGADVLGNLTRLSNLANGIEPSIEKTRNVQIQLEQQLASAEEEVKRPFPQATELTEKSKRLAVLERQRILGRAGEHQRHPCGGGTFPAGNGRRAERGGRCPLRKFCRGRCVRPQRHDHPQRNLRSRSYRLGQQRMQLLAEQSCPLCQHHQRQLYEHGCRLLVLLHRRGAVYLLDCYLQLKLLLVFIHKL